MREEQAGSETPSVHKYSDLLTAEELAARLNFPPRQIMCEVR
jgi:hypothetical protein